MNTFSSQKNKRRAHTPPPAGHLPPGSPHSRQAHQGRISPTSADTSIAGAFRAAIFAMIFVPIMGVIFLLIATLVGYRSTDPLALIPYLSLAALGLTALLGGLISARRKRGHPLLSGLLCGLLINLLLLSISLFFGDEVKSAWSLGFTSPVQWGLHATVALLSLLGAKLGMRRR